MFTVMFRGGSCTSTTCRRRDDGGMNWFRQSVRQTMVRAMVGLHSRRRQSNMASTCGDISEHKLIEYGPPLTNVAARHGTV